MHRRTVRGWRRAVDVRRVQHGDRRSRQLGGGRLGGEEHGEPGVVDHELQPLDRVGGVERDVRRPELERGEHADEHVDAPVHGDADTIAGG